MRARYQEAASLIGGQSRVVSPLEPFMFGCPSMWMLFYAKSGDMERNADLFSSMLSVYTALTGGHGSGADEIYRGECYCVQARFEEAEICAYKAAYCAEAAGQVTVAYGAAMLLGIIAVYRNDDVCLKKAVEQLEAKASHYTRLHDTPLNTCMLESVRGYLMGLMLLTQHYPAWARDDGGAQMNLTFVNFLVYQSRVTDLVLQKKYGQAIARIEVLLRCDPRLGSAAARNFMLAGLALCYLAIVRVNRAAEALDAALTLAAPDHNYTFHARLRKVFAVLYAHPRIAAKHRQAIREIRALKIDYAAPDEKLMFRDIQPTWLPKTLTAREREAAIMAAAGMRNQEIAQALKITEATVKSHLNAVFQKLHIDRRSKIIEMLENEKD
jgi:LuxR family maltose regulon positive regulatory protein